MSFYIIPDVADLHLKSARSGLGTGVIIKISIQFQVLILAFPTFDQQNLCNF